MRPRSDGPATPRSSTVDTPKRLRYLPPPSGVRARCTKLPSFGEPMTVFPELSPFPFIMALPFAITMMALHFIIFRPLLQFLDQRTKTIDGARDEAKVLSTQIEDRLHSVEERLKTARSEAGDVRKAARERAHAASTEILAPTALRLLISRRFLAISPR